jgi:arylsulfatase A-like enzyme
VRKIAGCDPGRGALIGAAFAAALFAWDLVRNASFSVMGVQNQALADTVFHQYLGRILALQGEVLAFMLALGVVAGALVRTALGGARRAGRWTLAALGVAHLSWSAGALVHAPQLFTEAMYDVGGWRADLQVWLTDHLSPFTARLPALAIGVAVLVGLARRLWRWRSSRAVAAPAALAAAAMLGGSTEAPAPKGPPNVLILAADSLRADLVPDDAVAPNLARLAARGTRLARTYTAIPRTFPSWVTLLTGRWPSTNNLRHMFPRAEQRAVDFRALPERLAGYESAVVSDFAGDIFSRIDLGFRRVVAPTFNFRSLVEERSLEVHPNLLPYVTGTLGRRLFPTVDEWAQLADAELVTDRAVDTLDDMAASGKPWLLTVFYGNAHFPYAAQWPHYRLFTDPAYRGRYRYHRPPDVTGAADETDADRAQIQGLFRGAIHEVDEGAARLLAHLAERGLDGNTIVVVVADHGENLGEDGNGIGHGEHLRGEAALRVPFVFAGPGLPAGKVLDGVARTVDLTPTLLGLLGQHPTDVDGADLGPWIRGEAPDPKLPAYVETGIWFSDKGKDFYQRERLPYPNVTGLGEIDHDHGDEVVLRREYAGLINVAKHRAWIEGDWKLVYVPLPDGVRFELYDEREHDGPDRAAEHPDVVARLRERLYAQAELYEQARVRAGYILPGPDTPSAWGRPLVPRVAAVSPPAAAGAE